MNEIAERYTICGAREVLGKLDGQDYALVISIEHPGAEGDGKAPRLNELNYLVKQHIAVFWDNFVEDAPQLCTEENTKEMLDLMREHRGSPILIHCRQGKARSAAVALMGIADELGAGREREAVDLLNQIRDVATPNPLILRQADKILERDGRLVEAVLQHPAIAARMPHYVDAVRRSMLKHAAADPERAGGIQAAPERIDASLRRLLGPNWQKFTL